MNLFQPDSTKLVKDGMTMPSDVLLGVQQLFHRVKNQIPSAALY